MTTRRAAVHFRVSTDRQTVENQRPDVERLVADRGFDVVQVYEEQASTKRRRPEYERMMAGARAGRFDVLSI